MYPENHEGYGVMNNIWAHESLDKCTRKICNLNLVDVSFETKIQISFTSTLTYLKCIK